MPRLLYPVDHSGDVEHDPPVLETQCYWVRCSDGSLARHPEQNRTLVFQHVENAEAAAEEHQARMREFGQSEFEAWVVGPGRPERHEQNLRAMASKKPVPYPATPHQASTVASQVTAKIEAEAALTAVVVENNDLRKELAEMKRMLEALSKPAEDTAPPAATGKPSNLGGRHKPGPKTDDGEGGE